MARALFILKQRQDYSSDIPNADHKQVATGMFNSATFVANMLKTKGIHSHVVVVVDNNDIDREVTAYKPTHVFIEGYWVIPEKFDELMPLHPKVEWIVRCHSEMPFLAQEGIAIDWTFKYLTKGVIVSGNSPRINEELRMMARESLADFEEEDIEEMVPLLPNFYPVPEVATHRPNNSDRYYDVGCFGAIRPMKNHMVQAMAAIAWAKEHHKILRFHINAGRVELSGQSMLNNLRALFAHTKHELVEHNWTGHDEFLDIIRSMDVCMQVSFTETFNIVAADAVAVGCPVLTSSEINWTYPIYADPTSSADILSKLNQLWENRGYYCAWNRQNLLMFGINTRTTWVNYILGDQDD